MRRNFVEVLKQGNIDLEREYSRLYDLFYYGPCGDYQNSLYGEVERRFESIPFRDTCVSLEDFDQTFGFNFEDYPSNFDIDYLVSFCEYVYNLLNAISYGGEYIKQIGKVIKKIGYTRVWRSNLAIFVEESPAVVAVAESPLIPNDLSYKLISYNHHSMKGNLQEKKNTILQLADLLEPKREELTIADKSLSSDLFYLFNNLNLRHNNIDPALKGKYKKVVADMAPEELEQWYDETYQMCLLAFLQLEQAERKVKFGELKAKIEQR